MRLDIGVGAGPYTCNPRLFGSDVIYIDKTRPLPNQILPNFVVCTVENLPFKDEAFEEAIMSEVLYYLRESLVALVEVRRVLKTNGILTVLQPNFCTNEAVTDKNIVWVFTYFSLKRLLNAAGFKTAIHFPIGDRFPLLMIRPFLKFFFILFCSELRAIARKS